MARNRLLKKDFFPDPKVGSLPLGARLLFQALWVYADDSGHGQADARLLKAQAFPYDADISAELVESWLHAMVELRMILLYEVEGQRYFEVRNFAKHQVISHPSKFEYPKPTTASQPEHSGSSPGVPTEHSESTPPQSKSKSNVNGNEKENENGERKGKADLDGRVGLVSPDDLDLTSKADGDRKICAKKTNDYLMFAGLETKKMGGSFTPEFKGTISAEFLMYKTQVHDEDEECCCSRIDFLEGVIQRCKRNEINYPKGLIRVKRAAEAQERAS